MLFGNNIGRVTAILASVGANRTAKRTAVVHLLFNVLALPSSSSCWAFRAGYRRDVARRIQRQIANAHTLFVASTTPVLFPSAGPLRGWPPGPWCDIIEEAFRGI